MNRKTDKGSILIDTSYTEEMLQDFTSEEVGEIFLALLASANRGEEYETDDRSMRTLYRTIQASINKSNERYEEKCERNRQIALDREKKRKETKCEEEHERARTCTKSTNVHERAKNTKEEHEKHERARTSPIMIISNNIKDPKGSMLEQSSNVVLEVNNARDTRARDKTPSAKKERKIDFEKVRQQFNRIMEGKKMPKVKAKITAQRQAFFEARVREYGIIAVYRVMIKASQSNFLNGGGNKAWVANFEWIFRPNNFPKVLDGYYDNKPEPEPSKTEQSNGGIRNEATKTTTAGNRATNYNEQRVAEQRERIKGYAGIASKWRQIAESDSATVGHTAKPT